MARVKKREWGRVLGSGIALAPRWCDSDDKKRNLGLEWSLLRMRARALILCLRVPNKHAMRLRGACVWNNTRVCG